MLLVLAAFFMAAGTQAQQLIRVPADQPNLQAAIGAVSDGGVIEMAPGTYQAPAGGFTIYDFPSPKGFRIRAASAGSVTLSGGDTTDILRFAPSNLAAGKPVTFENLVFANGVSTQNFLGGGLTLVNAQAIFTSCTFRDNAANAPGPGTGGGAQWIAGAIVSFDSCNWMTNRSPNFGAGMSVLDSRVFIRNSRFTGNRTNFSGHSSNSAGGAIFVNDGTLRVSNCSFDDNQAGYVGGAIYAIGFWRAPEAQPTADIVIQNSAFNNNIAAFAAGTPNQPGPAVGGAVHVEGQTTAKIYNCRFTGNTARQGGAFSNYLALSEINRCVFTNNTATGTALDEGQGGAIIALSSEAGTVNHRPMELVVIDSLIRFSTARQGAAIFAGGDLNFAYGLGGSPVNGTPASNRAKVKLTRVAIADCMAGGGSGLPGSGGGLLGAFIDLTIDNSIIEKCTAANGGAGIQLIQNSVAEVRKMTIAGCTADELGTAFTLFGSALNLSESNIVENRINGPGRGIGITSAPSPAGGGLPAFDVTGLIADTVFSNNIGASIIYDGDRFNADGPPYNRLQFSRNHFFPDNASVYFSDIIGARNVAQLNSLVIPRSDGTQTIKAPVANTAPASAPEVSALLMVPPVTLPSGAPGETTPVPASLVYAGSGGAITLDGAPQTAPGGVVQTAADTSHTLRVGSSVSNTTPPSGAALNISTRLPVLTGDNVMIGGFIIVGPNPKTVVIRAVGPSLTAAGVPGALADPVLEIFSGPTRIGSNNNWRTTEIGGAITSRQAVEIDATGVAPQNDAEAAVVLTLAPGPYTAIVSGAGGGTGVGLVEIYDTDAIPTSTLGNISTRGFVQTGDNVMIGGFIVRGGNGPTNAVVRAIGPSTGLANALSDPTLQLFDSNGQIVAENDNWRDSQQAAITAFGLQPTDDRESVIVQTALPRGAYTAIVRGKNGGTGVGLVEAYVFP